MRYVFVLAMLFFVVGCKERLETGYEPRPLSDNEDTRRAYYAPPFSPESHVTDSNGNVRSPIQPMIGSQPQDEH